MTEFNLSDGIYEAEGWNVEEQEMKEWEAIPVKNVKEFIRLLKEEFPPQRKVNLTGFQIHRIIDKLAGDKFTKLGNAESSGRANK